MKFKIIKYFCNGQKNWCIGSKTNFINDLKYLGTIYDKLTIHSLKIRKEYINDKI